jgi:HJR/Mrr/RecB family endonuclease
LIVLLGLRPLGWKNQPFQRRVQRSLVNVLFAWLVWACLWGFILWHDRSPILILPLQVNNLAFLLLGAITGSIILARGLWRWRVDWVVLARTRKLDDLKTRSPQDFEALVASLFKAYGHDVELVGGHSDHGVDIFVRNEAGEKWVVQCKRYNGSVGEPVLRDLYGTMLHENAQGAYLITTGTFTQGAVQWAAEKPIILYDGEALIKRILSVQRRKSFQQPE